MIEHMLNWDLPDFIADNFLISDYKPVPLSLLRVKLTPLTKGAMGGYVDIHETPHYGFVCNYLYGTPVAPSHGYIDYSYYNGRNQHQLDAEGYKELIDGIVSYGFNNNKCPILVLRPRRLSINPPWHVIDGSHRVAILAALNINKIDVGILKFKKTIFSRILDKVSG